MVGVHPGQSGADLLDRASEFFFDSNVLYPSVSTAECGQHFNVFQERRCLGDGDTASIVHDNEPCIGRSFGDQIWRT